MDLVQNKRNLPTLNGESQVSKQTNHKGNEGSLVQISTLNVMQ